MGLIKTIKKNICKYSSVYEDGVLKTPGRVTIFWIIIAALNLWVIGNIIIEAVHDPRNGATVVGVIIGLFVVLIITFKVATTICGLFLKQFEKKFEIVCDRIVFPDNVKKIFQEIESLSNEDKKIFKTGMDAIIRKWS